MSKVRLCHFRILIHLPVLKSPLSLILPFVWLLTNSLRECVLGGGGCREVGTRVLGDRKQSQSFLTLPSCSFLSPSVPFPQLQSLFGLLPPTFPSSSSLPFLSLPSLSHLPFLAHPPFLLPLLTPFPPLCYLRLPPFLPLAPAFPLISSPST